MTGYINPYATHMDPKKDEKSHTCVRVRVCASLCACVRVCVRMCAHVCVSVCTCMHACAGLRLCVCVCVHVCVRVCVHACMCVCACVCLCACMCMRACTCEGVCFLGCWTSQLKYISGSDNSYMLPLPEVRAQFAISPSNSILMPGQPVITTDPIMPAIYGRNEMFCVTGTTRRDMIPNTKIREMV